MKNMRGSLMSGVLVIVGLVFAWPILSRLEIFAGDEPHYLVVVSSLIQDGDLDVGNNYAAVSLGGWDAGRRARGQVIDRHSVITIDSMPYWYRDVFTIEGERLEESKDIDLTQKREYSEHSMVMPLIYYLPTVLLTLVTSIEHGSVGVSLLLGLVTLAMFFRLCLQLVNKTEALMAVLILGFATPFWYYAGSLFPAVLLTLLMIISIDGYWRRRRVWMVGLMVGLMVMIKAVYGVVWVGLMLDSWLRREFKAVVLIGLGGLVSIVVLLGMNGFFYGQADFFPVIGNVWELSTLLVNNPWTSLAGLVGGKNTGLVVFSPFLLVWPWMVVNTKIWQLEKLRELLMIPGLVVVAFSFWPGWDGGYAFGYRQMLPMVPLLILSLVWWWGKNRHHGLFNGMVVCLLLLSFLNQAWSMMVDPGEIWSKPPVVLQVLGFASNNLD